MDLQSMGGLHKLTTHKDSMLAYPEWYSAFKTYTAAAEVMQERDAFYAWNSAQMKLARKKQQE